MKFIAFSPSPVSLTIGRIVNNIDIVTKATKSNLTSFCECQIMHENAVSWPSIQRLIWHRVVFFCRLLTFTIGQQKSICLEVSHSFTCPHLFHGHTSSHRSFLFWRRHWFGNRYLVEYITYSLLHSPNCFGLLFEFDKYQHYNFMQLVPV